ncbi:pyruvate, water dikinase [Geodermatophilus siccatus]|uniref:Pyruvate, water dikinase n=1 Tax=Geodermatophilus siccatus TaxID=1137991 RepID=A0A1G9YCN9_9ACTN|nr:PEP/pyruvate-binding domain-containing protein [Geodermatophilus siccatus]SDN06717.1 pyruvate, water dikinase [Geodermatophilus siccatus]
MDTAPQATATDSGRHPVVVPLRDLDAGDLAQAGGKAANLGELIGAGFPVPDGFCVTTDAYAELAEAAGLADLLDDPAADLARTARERILAAPVPAHVAEAVAAAYAELGESVPVAVRSSATAEDLPFASFAGQQDTYLDVVGTDAVLDAVHRCWASLWTDRAVVYRARNGIDSATTRLAVVVQRMVPASVAGVMFTANPVTGRRTETVVDAAPGLGEAVVSGSVDPDHVVLDSGTGTVLERRPGGGREACLTDGQLRELVRLGARVQEHYGRPQDTEWAIDADGTLWLTQARPVTTLFPVPQAGTADGGLRVWFCASLAQGLTRPLTPMGISVFQVVGGSVQRLAGRPPADPVAGSPRVRAAAGRLFFDVTPIVRSTAGRAVFPRLLDVMEARSAVVLRALFDDPRLSLVHRSWLPVVRRLARVAARYGVPLQVVQALVRPAAARRRVDRVGARLRARRLPGDDAPADERLDAVLGLLGNAVPTVVPRVLPPVAAGFAAFGLAARLLGDTAQPGDLGTVLRGLPHNVTTEMDLELWRLATAVRADEPSAAALRDGTPAALAERYRSDALPAVLQRGLRLFLARYGIRAVAEIDVGVPRWAEDPAHLLGVLGNYLLLDDPDRAPDGVFARSVAEAEDVVATLTARARLRGRARGAVVGFALDRTRQLAGLRELPKYDLVLVLDRVRALLASIGADLASRGVLARADDVFLLDLAEVRVALGDGRSLQDVVTERRESYEREMGRRHVPRVLLSDGTEPEAVSAGPAVADGALLGTAASAGTVTGRARVVLEPTGAQLQPGEVLVAPSTDPGWTPLFLTAGGLVMEMGGANSHGAVVAREYGIPAVVGVPGATSRVETGQEVTVDGTRGVVVPLGATPS